MKSLRLYILIISIFFACIAVAKVDCLIFHFNDGSQAIIPFKEARSITFDNGLLRVDNHVFELDNVKRYEFGDAEQGGVMNIDAELTGWQIGRNGIIKAPFSLDGHIVHVFTVDGKMVTPRIYGATIDISHLPAAIYIIQVDGKSFKTAVL